MILDLKSKRIAKILIFLLILPLMVLIQAYIIPTFEKKIYQNKKDTTRIAVEIAIGTIDRIYADFKTGKIKEGEAKTHALNILSNIRYNTNEYYWVNDLAGKMIMHPANPEIVGLNLLGMKDSEGKFLFVEMINVVKKGGGGFVKYTWPKPNTKKAVPKISYVKQFKPWGWIVGNGVYVDDIADEMSPMIFKIWTVIAITMVFAGVLVFAFSRFLEMKRIKNEIVQLELDRARIAQQIAEDLADKKTKFLDIAAHELRTPITSLSLLLQLALRQIEKGNTVNKDLITRLKEPTDRLKILIIDLLDMSRLERGLVKLGAIHTDIVSLIEKCVEDFRMLAPTRTFIFNKPDQTIELELDPVRINQVLSNLLDNAIKYTNAGDIEVTVEEKNNFVRVSVIDHGTCVSAEQQAVLFTAFSRGKSEATIRAGGLGLGLSICRGIIELHGGTIGLNSKEGHGCIFYFTLPKKDKSVY